MLELLPAAKQRKIKRLLGYNPSTAGGLMNPDFVSVAASAPRSSRRSSWCARSDTAPGAHRSTSCVVDEEGRLVGAVSVGGARQSRARTSPSAAWPISSSPSVAPETEVPEVARLMTDYNLIALPVVDGDGTPIGVVTVDDVLELMLPEDWRRRYGLRARARLR